MTISDLGDLGEFISSIVVLVSVVYLAAQVRQNTAQQKREETISIQLGQNEVVRQMQDPVVLRAYVRFAAGDGSATVADNGRATSWILQYLNHFQIVYDLHHDGALSEERYLVWESWAVSIVAGKGARDWWDGESGKLAFTPAVRERIDRRLADPETPPVPIGQMWSSFSPEEWKRSNLDLGE